MAEGKQEPHKIFIEGVDMGSDIYSDPKAEVRIISKAIRRLGSNPRRLLYRGFNGERLDIILEQGTDTPGIDFVFATPFYYLGIGSAEPNPLNYAFDFERMALACYDAKQMKGNEYEMKYFFRNPDNKLDALVGVLKLYYHRYQRLYW